MENNESKNKRRFPIWAIVLIIILIVGILSCVPFLINYAYKKGGGYETVWNGAEFLAFYGAALSAIGAFLLGAITIWQNKKLREQNEKIRQDNNEAQKRIEKLTLKANEITTLSLIVENENNRINKLTQCVDEFVEICIAKDISQKYKTLGNKSLTVTLLQFDLTRLHREIQKYCVMDRFISTEKREFSSAVTALRDKSLEYLNYIEESFGEEDETLGREVANLYGIAKDRWESYLFASKRFIYNVLLGEYSLDVIKRLYCNSMEEENGQVKDAE